MNVQPFMSHAVCGHAAQASPSSAIKSFLAAAITVFPGFTFPSLRRCAPMIDMRQASMPCTSRCTSCETDIHINDASTACFTGAFRSFLIFIRPVDGIDSIGRHGRQQRGQYFGRHKALEDYTTGVHHVVYTEYLPIFFCGDAHG